jgi:hypothetical protein
MQHTDEMQTEPLDLRFQDASQQEADTLVEALERWLDDGGSSSNEVAYNVGASSFSLPSFKSRKEALQGGSL